MEKPIVMDMEYIQTEAKTFLGRKLTDNEYDQVCIAINEGLFFLIQDSFCEVIKTQTKNKKSN